MKNIQQNWPAEKTDQFLQEKYSLSLYHFTVSLDDIFSTSDYRTMKVASGSTGHPTRWRDFWKDKIESLKRLRRYNKKSLDAIKKFHDDTDKYLNSYIEPYLPFKDFNLEIDDISTKIDEYIKIIEDYFLASKTRKGGSEENKNIVFLVWSHFVKSRIKDTVHVKTILNLMNWFSTRTRIQDLKTSNKSEPNFRKYIWRYKKQKELTPAFITIIQDFKDRFLVPIKDLWLEHAIKGFDLDEPIITFSNGEKLTPKDCLSNNPAYKDFISSEMDPVFTQAYDFRDSQEGELPVYIKEGEKETSAIDLHFALEELLKESDPD